MSQFKFYTDNKNVIRWNTNDTVPFEDMLGQFLIEGLISEKQYKDSNEVREKEASDFLKLYIEQSRNVEYTTEQLSEMKSAFGEGSCIIDVISGKVVRW